jgi:hypothetical protein
MKLLPVGDGRTYIDLGKVTAKVRVPGAMYYKSEDEIWVRKDSRRPAGQVISEQEAFMAFMNAGRFREAGQNFPKLFADGAKVEVVIERPATPSQPKKWPISRFAAGAALLILVGVYIGLIVTGTISASRQISVTNLVVILVVLIIVAILIRPQVLSNVQEFGLGGLNIKLQGQLKELKETQEDHTENLNDIQFILASLVTISERKHLNKLANGTATNYRYSDALLRELRRLRDIGLIEQKQKMDPQGNKYRIGKLLRLTEPFDLGSYVDITPRGNEYIRRINEAEASAGSPARRDGANG